MNSPACALSIDRGEARYTCYCATKPYPEEQITRLRWAFLPQGRVL